MDSQSASSHCSAANLTYLEQKSLPLAPVASIPMYFVICRLPRTPHNSIYLHDSIESRGLQQETVSSGTAVELACDISSPP